MQTRLVVISLGVFLSCANLAAQSTFGTVLGSVRDSSGGLIAGATLKLTELDESTILTASSNAQGLYEFLNVRPGRYDIKAEKPGFAMAHVSDVRLQARQSL